VPNLAQFANQRLAEMAGASRHQYSHARVRGGDASIRG
jgi:hypothetical protein